MDAAHVEALARDLAAASLTSEGVRALIGADAEAALGRMVATPARRMALRHPGPRSTLLRAFVLGDAVAAAELADALPALTVQGAVALGLIEVADGAALPQVAIRPYAFLDAHGAGEWWIASDLDELAGRWPLRPDHVLGVGGAARTLAALLPPAPSGTPVGTALDLGTGCGVIALHLRRLAQRVTATDISSRALWFTRLNARLNGIDGIETRLGSLYEPVAGERFDLIASNPPFVITPRRDGVPEYEYRDGGRTGDALMAAVLAGLHEHLLPGASARLLGNWETVGDATGLERVRAWVEGCRLDAWAIERESLDPARYAEIWLRDGGTLARDERFGGLATAWLDDFEERRVAGIGMGWLALRRTSDAPTLRRFERLGHAVALEHVGAHLAAAFDDAARLAGLSDDALAAMHLTVAPDVTEARHQLPGAAGPNVIELRQGGGLGRTVSVDTALAALVGASDGELPVGTLVHAIAGLLEVDASMLASDLLPRVRELVVTGFLRRLSD